MDFSTFTAGLKASPTAVYLFCGEESYFRHKGAELLRSYASGGCVRFSGSETPWPRVLDEVYTASMTGGTKLVVYADDGNYLHNHAALIEEYAASPSTAAILAALIPGKTPSVRSKRVVTVDCRPLKGLDLARWVAAEFQRRGKTAEKTAVQLLLELSAHELAALERTIESVVSYAGPKGGIGVDEIRALVADQSSHDIYELALAAASKKLPRALEILHRLVAAGEPTQVLLWKVAWQYRKLLEAKKLLRAGVARYEVPSRLQITFFGDEFLGLVDGHSLEELMAKHERILETDLALKSSGGLDRLLLEKLVCELASESKSLVRGPSSFVGAGGLRTKD